MGVAPIPPDLPKQTEEAVAGVALAEAHVRTQLSLSMTLM